MTMFQTVASLPLTHQYFLSQKLHSLQILECASDIDFIMEAKHMNPDQTALLEQSVLGLYCLQYRLLKIIKDNKSCDGLEKG